MKVNRPTGTFWKAPFIYNLQSGWVSTVVINTRRVDITTRFPGNPLLIIFDHMISLYFTKENSQEQILPKG